MAGTIFNPQNVSEEVVNLAQVLASLDALGPAVLTAAWHAAKTEGNYELYLTQKRVPIESGELLKSSRLEEPEIGSGNDLTYGIAYGGPPGIGRNLIGTNSKQVDYALLVHEDLDAKHRFSQSAKYVEDVVREELESGRASERMGAQIRRELGLEGRAPASAPRIEDPWKGSWAGGAGSQIRGTE